MVHKLRQLAVLEMREHSQRYRILFTDEEAWQSFLDDLEQDHHWAGHEALAALADNLGITIIIIQIAKDPITQTPRNGVSDSKTIYLAYLANCHYDLIVEDRTHPKNVTEGSDSKDESKDAALFMPVTIPVLLSTALIDEIRAANWLVSSKLIKEEIQCPDCEKVLSLQRDPRELAQVGYYYCHKCDQRIYARSLCFLHRLHSPLHLVLKVALAWFQGKEKKMIHDEVGLSLKSILLITKRLDTAATMLFTSSLHQIGGPEQVVEIDEANMPRSKNNKGRKKPSCWVLGMVQRPIREGEVPPAILASVPDRSKDTLQSYIKKFVCPGTLIVTDEWKGYHDLESIGYTHRTVCHDRNFVNPETLAHTQRIESLWRWVRKKALPASGTTPSRIDYYLSSFNYRRSLNGDVMSFLRDLFSIKFQDLDLELDKRAKADCELQLEKTEEKIMEKLELSTSQSQDILSDIISTPPAPTTTAPDLSPQDLSSLHPLSTSPLLCASQERLASTSPLHSSSRPPIDSPTSVPPSSTPTQAPSSSLACSPPPTQITTSPLSSSSVPEDQGCWPDSSSQAGDPIQKLLRTTFKTNKMKRKTRNPSVSRSPPVTRDVSFNVGDHASAVIKTRFQIKRRKEAEKLRRELRRNQLSTVRTRSASKKQDQEKRTGARRRTRTRKGKGKKKGQRIDYDDDDDDGESEEEESQQHKKQRARTHR